jgi:hypothetical protein
VTGKLSYTDVVNLSMNQTLARSINTSLVAILPILSVLVLGAQIMGAVTLEYFGLALLIGLTSGAYSSIFIASPLLAILKEHEERYRRIRERLESRGTAMLLLSPAAVAAGALATAETAPPTRRRRQEAQAGSSQTLRPGSARAAAKRASEEELEDADTSEDFESAGAGDQGTRRQVQAPSGPPGRPKPRPAASSRVANSAHRPPPRPRKKRKHR